MSAYAGKSGRLVPVQDEIAAMRKAGATLQEIGDRFGCTREMIRLVCNALGVNPPPSRETYRRFAAAVAVAARRELRAQRGGSLHEHGDFMRYNEGCRCARCREANTEKSRARRASKPKPQRHGTTTAYVNDGCRCARCKEAGSYHNRLSRLRRAAAAHRLEGCT